MENVSSFVGNFRFLSVNNDIDDYFLILDGKWPKTFYFGLYSLLFDSDKDDKLLSLLSDDISSGSSWSWLIFWSNWFGICVKEGLLEI